MQLQENGLPIGAEFVRFGPATEPCWMVNDIGRLVEWTTKSASYLHYVIVRFPTYGKPLEQVDLKGRKLLGGSLTTSWGRLVAGMDYVASDGSIKTAMGGENGDFIRLEPLPKKNSVLFLELLIDEHGNVKVQDGPCALRSSTFDARDLRIYGGGVIKEVDDEA